jgi:shikimate 5-dehydrogenase
MRLALIGDPVAHSRSPQILESLLRGAGIGGSYDLIRVPSGEAARAIARLREDGYTGCNVTSPLKEEAPASCERLTIASQRAGAVNTLSFGSYVLGTTTDGVGAAAALREALGDLAGRTVLVLGTGPTARAALGHLADDGANLWLWGRDERKVRRLCARVGALAFSPECAPAAVFSALVPEADLPSEVLHVCGNADAVMDANYGERSTLQVKLDRPVIDGSRMLEIQARASLDFWIECARPLG